MFVDRVEIEVQAGDGGNGAVTFGTEQDVPGGGPRASLWRVSELQRLALCSLLRFCSVGDAPLNVAISVARPKIAAFPFITLVPSRVVACMDLQRPFTVAALPGRIGGAHEGV